MLFLFLFGLIIVGILIGIGIAIGIAILLVLFMLFSLGLISTSAFIGLYQRSFQTGFKALVLLTTTISATIVGMLGFLAVNHFQHWFTAITALGIGSVSGFVAGALLGFLVHAVIRNISAMLYLKYRSINN